MKILNPWLILAAIGILAASFSFGYYQGGKAKQRAVEAAQAKAAQEARKDVVRVENQYEKILQNIRSKDSGGCVSPVIRDAVDSLPDRSR